MVGEMYAGYMYLMGLGRVLASRNSLDTLIQLMLGKRAGGVEVCKDGAGAAAASACSGLGWAALQP